MYLTIGGRKGTERVEMGQERNYQKNWQKTPMKQAVTNNISIRNAPDVLSGFATDSFDASGCFGFGILACCDVCNANS